MDPALPPAAVDYHRHRRRSRLCRVGVAVAAAAAVGAGQAPIQQALAGAEVNPALSHIRPPAALSHSAAAAAVAERGDDAMWAFLNPDNAGFRARYSGDLVERYATAWELSQAANAVLTLAELPTPPPNALRQVRAVMNEINQHYWDPKAHPAAFSSNVLAPLGGGGPTYYDDNNWIGMDLMRAYRLTGDRAYLRHAQQVFQLEIQGWDAAPGRHSGGVRWTQASVPVTRNTVSTAGAAVLGYQLAQVTHDPQYTQWADRMYDWVRVNLLASNGLYADHVNANGSVDGTQWSYNQGLMIQAGVERFQMSGDRSYLEQAQGTAAASLGHWAKSGFAGQPAYFNAIFFQALASLNAEQPVPGYGAALQRVAGGAARILSSRSGLAPSGPSQLLQQSGSVVLVASEAGVPKRQGPPAAAPPPLVPHSRHSHPRRPRPQAKHHSAAAPAPHRRTERSLGQ